MGQVGDLKACRRDPQVAWAGMSCDAKSHEIPQGHVVSPPTRKEEMEGAYSVRKKGA
jgi:hypothetical protein